MSRSSQGCGRRWGISDAYATLGVDREFGRVAVVWMERRHSKRRRW